jgi:uncharacterized protein YbjT (DUF2867 family)
MSADEILVTGGNGFVGRHVVSAQLDRGRQRPGARTPRRGRTLAD